MVSVHGEQRNELDMPSMSPAMVVLGRDRCVSGVRIWLQSVRAIWCAVPGVLPVSCAPSIRGIPGAGISVMSGTLYLCANLSADGLILLVQLVQIVQR